MEICNKKELYIGLSALFIGFLYYFLFRETYLTRQFFFVNVNSNIPSFLHTFSFILISSSLYSLEQKYKAILSWVVVNILFESVQLISLENKTGFLINFVNGVFDWFDIVAIISGGLCAWFVIRFM